jgi:hypothetical protein
MMVVVAVFVETAEHTRLGDDEEREREPRVCHLGEGSALCGARSGLVMSLRAARRPAAPRCEACGTTRCRACVERLTA